MISIILVKFIAIEIIKVLMFYALNYETFIVLQR